MKTNLLIFIILLTALVTSIVYLVAYKQGFRHGQAQMAKEVTKILVDVGHKMATNGLPTRVK